jgi:ERCC4-type nuclease
MSSVASALDYDWKVILLMDRREFNNTGFIDEAKEKIDSFFHGTSPLDRNGTYPLYCESLHLSSADYMFVARKINMRTGRVLEERVLDLIVERKNINDLAQCLILPSKKYAPLTFFEAQMYKLQQCGIARKVFLMEGDENDPNEFYNMGYEKETEKRLLRVKTMRLQLTNGEYHGISIDCTRSKNDSLLYLIDQMVDLKKHFNPLRPPTMTMEDTKKRVDEGMKGATFQEYLRLRKLKGIGDGKAMKVIRDPDNSWDTAFISPACTSKKLKSTLEDRATFYVSPAHTQPQTRVQGANLSAPIVANRCQSECTRRPRQTQTENQNSSGASIRRRDEATVVHAVTSSAVTSSSVATSSGVTSSDQRRKDQAAAATRRRSKNGVNANQPSAQRRKIDIDIDPVSAICERSAHDSASSVLATSTSHRRTDIGIGAKPNVSTRSPLDGIPSQRKGKSYGSYAADVAFRAEFLKAAAQGYEGGSVSSNQGVTRVSNSPSSHLGNNNKGWTCIACTFTNENMCFLVCEICDEERP